MYEFLMQKLLYNVICNFKKKSIVLIVRGKAQAKVNLNDQQGTWELLIQIRW